MKVNKKIYKDYFSDIDEHIDSKLKTIYINGLTNKTKIISEYTQENGKILSDRESRDTPDYIINKSNEYFGYLESLINTNNFEIEAKRITCKIDENNELFISPTIIINIENQLDGFINFSDIAEEIISVGSDTGNIPITDSTLISRIRMSNLKPEEISVLSPDLTIDFETKEPHKYWVNIDTLEEYIEKTAKIRENITKEELENKDVYHSHFHLSGRNAPIDLCSQLHKDILNHYIDIDDFTNITKSVHHLTLFRDKDKFKSQIYLGIQ